MTSIIRRRVCATGKNPDDAIIVPDFQSNHFRGELIQETAAAMIASFQELSWIRDREDSDRLIWYVWKRNGGKSRGAEVFGGAQMASSYVKYLTDSTFVIWMAADHCKLLPNYEFEGLVLHQLLHLYEREIESHSPDKATTFVPALRDHEFSGFESELLRYGVHTPELRHAGATFQKVAKQLKMDMSATDGDAGSKRGKKSDEPVEPIHAENAGVLDDLESESEPVAVESIADQVEQDMQSASATADPWPTPIESAPSSRPVSVQEHIDQKRADDDLAFDENSPIKTPVPFRQLSASKRTRSTV